MKRLAQKLIPGLMVGQRIRLPALKSLGGIATPALAVPGNPVERGCSGPVSLCLLAKHCVPRRCMLHPLPAILSSRLHSTVG
jgi:hypothetical protein